MGTEQIVIREQLGADYVNALAPVDAASPAVLQDASTRRQYPVQ
jgi:hypothetical protein